MNFWNCVNSNRLFLNFRILSNILVLLLLGFLYTQPRLVILSAKHPIKLTDIRTFVGVAFSCVLCDLFSAAKTLIVVQVKSLTVWLKRNVYGWLYEILTFCGMDSVEGVSATLTALHILLFVLLIFICVTLQIRNIMCEIILMVFAILLAILR